MPEWINRLATIAAVFGVLAGAFWIWDWNDYRLPDALDPSYDPFAVPSETTVIQKLAGNLRWAKNRRTEWIFERRTQRKRERETARGFSEFKFEGVRFYFYYQPVGAEAEIQGEFTLSQSSRIEKLESEGDNQPLSIGLRFVRSGRISLTLESETTKEKWTVVGHQGPREYSPPPIDLGPAITLPRYGPELQLVDESGNRLVITAVDEEFEASVAEQIRRPSSNRV